MIIFPWPQGDRSLSSNGGVGSKHGVNNARKAAKKAGADAALWARARNGYNPNLPEKGDILLCITFRPPNRRWDRLNMPGLFKSHFDGLAEFWGVNDRRFLPVIVFGEPLSPGACWVEVIDV